MKKESEQSLDEAMVSRKRLLIVKRGMSYYTIKTGDIAFIYTVDETTFIVDKQGRKTFCGTSLNKIEEQLDDYFFRANRQFIINIDYIKSFRIHDKTKLIVEMKVDDDKAVIHVSQITAPKFKEWITKF
jgi:DNA-binding LytR/AlgR family response regulator